MFMYSRKFNNDARDYIARVIEKKFGCILNNRISEMPRVKKVYRCTWPNLESSRVFEKYLIIMGSDLWCGIDPPVARFMKEHLHDMDFVFATQEATQYGLYMAEDLTVLAQHLESLYHSINGQVQFDLKRLNDNALQEKKLGLQLSKFHAASYNL